MPGKDEDGNDAPVKYLACLVNLEGQYDVLLDRSPDPVPSFVTPFMVKSTVHQSMASYDDHQVMGTALAPRAAGINAGDLQNLTQPVPLAPGVKGSRSTQFKSGAAATAGAVPYSGSGTWAIKKSKGSTSADIALNMAEPFRVIQTFEALPLDPEYRFPVLLHWSFTTTGDTTFRSLMENLDSRLLGDVGPGQKSVSGRLPLEVAESGHVGLGHQTREGDKVRSWYRGPLVPHPTRNSSADRLKLAHSSDQLRVVIPDGREDLSLATAFETGRLLTLSQPSIIASLMRWRQNDYHAARLKSLLIKNRTLWEEVLGASIDQIDIRHLGRLSGRFFADAVVRTPEKFLGNPMPQVGPGRPLEFNGQPTTVLARGLGLPPALFVGDLNKVFEGLRGVQVPKEDLLTRELGKVDLRDTLEADLDRQRVDLVSSTLSNELINEHLTGPAFPVTDRLIREGLNDNLDVILRDRPRDFTDEDES